LPCPLPAPHQHRDLLVATDERRQMALARPGQRTISAPRGARTTSWILISS
jgi:hypothetical protein